jgi:hypothetical protein
MPLALVVGDLGDFQLGAPHVVERVTGKADEKPEPREVSVVMFYF